MSTATEIELPAANTVIVTQKKAVPVVYPAWGYVVIGLLVAFIGAAAATGLGQGDWYAVEMSTASPSFRTWYFGLRLYYECQGFPAQPIPATPGWWYTNTLLTVPTVTNGPCTATTYASALAASDSGSDAEKAFRQHVGAGAIILTLLAGLVIAAAFAVVASFISAFNAIHYFVESTDFYVTIVKTFAFVAIVINSLVIIFWITIFPYAYWYGIYASQPETRTPNLGTTFYYPLGVGFAIQIASLFASIAVLFIGQTAIPASTPYGEKRV